MAKQWRAAVIGSTGRGNYGHGLDVAFNGFENIEIVAVADDQAAGREAMGKKLGVRRLYAEYHEMLTKEKPDIVTVAPRHLDQRKDMILAAAAAGCQIFAEKPLAWRLTDADQIVEACRKAKVMLAVAHQNRVVPPAQQVLKDLQAGKFGALLRMKAVGKQDARGGGEDMIVLGTHLFDLMTMFAGPPKAVRGFVTQKGRPITVADARKPTEPVGLVAGDAITAQYQFDAGVMGSFETRQGVASAGASPYSLTLECAKALILLREDVFIYPAPCFVPENSKLTWEKLWVESWHFDAEHKPIANSGRLGRGNRIIVAEMIQPTSPPDRPRFSTGEDARWSVEMIQGVYAAHLAGRWLDYPLADRKHPFDQA